MNFFTNKYYFLYFVAITFVFVSTTAMSLTNKLDVQKNNQPKIIAFDKLFPPNPVLKSSANFPVLSAQGVIVTDLNSGVTLYEKNPDQKLLPASTTKIITALVAFDAFSLDQIVTVPKGIVVEGQKMGLFVGEKIKVEDLIYGLLVYSANDAAMTLAMSYPAGYDAFISAMNQKAQSLHMNNTSFENPVGLDGRNQTTTARDLFWASEVAMRNSEFAKIVGTRQITFTDATGKIKYNLKNVNELLGNVPGVLGIKTGWTEVARENLVTYYDNDGKKMIIVVLGSQDRFGETKELIKWVLENYDWQEVKAPYNLLQG